VLFRWPLFFTREAGRGQAAGRWLAQLDRRPARERCSNQRVDPVGSTQLVILPGTDHMATMSRTEWLVPMIIAFLDTAPPKPDP
jgi:hypothetical protein